MKLGAKFASSDKQKALQQFLGFLIVCLGAYLIYYTGSVFYELDKQIKVALITVGSAFVLAVTTNYVQRKRELDFRIREKKIEAYQKFFDFLLFFTKSMNLSESGAGAITPAQMVPRIYEVNFALIVSGSDVIIRKWQEFLQSTRGHDVAAMDQSQGVLFSLLMRQRLAEIILLIRKDLGHIDKAVDSGTISDVFMPLNFTAEDLAAINEALEKGTDPAAKIS